MVRRGGNEEGEVMVKNGGVWESIHKKRMWGVYPESYIVAEVCKLINGRHRGRPNRNRLLTALDVGCGVGANTWFLAEQGFETYGVDISPAAIKKSRFVMLNRGVCPTMEVGDVMKLRFKDRMFDLVVDCHTIQHVRDPAVAMQEIYRVLRPGGTYIGLLVAHDDAIRKGYGRVKFFIYKEDFDELFGKFSKMEVKLISDMDVRGNDHDIDTIRWLVVAKR